MRAFRLGHLLMAVAPAVAIGLAACGGSSTPFDPATLSQTTDDIILAMDSNQVVQSMDVLGDSMKTAVPSLSAAADLAALPRVALSGDFAAWATRHWQTLRSVSPNLAVASTQAVIDTSVRGWIFTYSVDLHHYQPSTRTGPDTGVRFVLYAVNPLTRQVVVPLDSIGYVDILDESTTGTNQVHLKAYSGSTTPLIDYTASASWSASTLSGSASANGYVSDGTREIDFVLTQTFSPAGLALDYTLTAPEKGVSVQFKASITLTQVASVTVTITTHNNVDVITANGTIGGSITGTIKHNGTVVINVSGTQDNPTFTDASGNPITGTDAQYLRKVALFIGAVLLHVDALLAPAHALFLLPF